MTTLLRHDGVDNLRGVHPLLWPVLLVRGIWLSAVADADAVCVNLRLLAVLTAVFSAPDLAQGLLTALHGAPGSPRLYGLYVLALGTLELAGALLLLARRPRWGARLILVAAAGFYVEAALGLAHFERGPLATAVFAVCAPAEAWVIWFLTHPRVRAQLSTRPSGDRA